jgi:hypothetical protein
MKNKFSNSRVLRFDHKVEAQPLRKDLASLYITWKGSAGRHNYIIVDDWEDFDILVSEFHQLLENHRHRKVVNAL